MRLTLQSKMSFGKAAGEFPADVLKEIDAFGRDTSGKPLFRNFGYNHIEYATPVFTSPALETVFMIARADGGFDRYVKPRNEKTCEWLSMHLSMANVSGKNVPVGSYIVEAENWNGPVASLTVYKVVPNV